MLGKMKELRRTDLKLMWITHAHYDHYGSAAALQKLTRARVGSHPLDSDCLRRGESPLGQARGRGILLKAAQALVMAMRPLPRVEPDFTLDDGDSLAGFGLDARILHTPGHTPGHTCLVLADGTTFAGDLIARRPRTRRQDLLATNWEQMQASLEKLKAARPELVYTGHSSKPIEVEILDRLG
jgi:glyoxylase-like metal-dependent hydrolase (beta-lactamase superfamily II)